jgi:hypothetical protein
MAKKKRRHTVVNVVPPKRFFAGCWHAHGYDFIRDVGEVKVRPGLRIVMSQTILQLSWETYERNL